MPIVGDCESLRAASEAAGGKQRAFDLAPTTLIEVGECCTKTLLARKRDVVEIESARSGHAVVFGENNLRVDATDSARRGYYDHFIQTGEREIT